LYDLSESSRIRDANDQISKKVSFGGCGVAADLGGFGIQNALEGKRTEQEYQNIICGVGESPGTARQDKCNDPTECLEIDKAHMGKGIVHVRTFGASLTGG